MLFSMKSRSILAGLPAYAAAAVLALGLKYHYSRASVDDLLWIMGPTAGLVSKMTGLSFAHDPSSGFVNHELGIAIAPACSGVNFLIIAFGMAFFSFAHRFKNIRDKYVWIAASLAGAYLLTLGVNSLRIGLSIVTLSHDIHTAWLTAERVHRMEGIVVYFLCLCLFYRGIHHLIPVHGRKTHNRKRPGIRALWPLFWYLAMALGVPLVTGNFQDHPKRFFEHGMTVLLICSGILLLFAGLRMVCRPEGRDQDSMV